MSHTTQARHLIDRLVRQRRELTVHMVRGGNADDLKAFIVLQDAIDAAVRAYEGECAALSAGARLAPARNPWPVLPSQA